MVRNECGVSVSINVVCRFNKCGMSVSSSPHLCYFQSGPVATQGPRNSKVTTQISHVLPFTWRFTGNVNQGAHGFAILGFTLHMRHVYCCCTHFCSNTDIGIGLCERCTKNLHCRKGCVSEDAHVCVCVCVMITGVYITWYCSEEAKECREKGKAVCYCSLTHSDRCCAWSRSRSKSCNPWLELHQVHWATKQREA